MLISKEVKVNMNGKNIKYYKDLGYNVPIIYDEKKKKYTVPLNTFTVVKVEDLPKNSTYKVDVKCDYCHDVINISYATYNKCMKEDGKYYCHKCYNIYNEKTFEQWCLEYNHKDYLDLWDYKLNDKKPNEVYYKSTYKAYFKCPRGLHKSTLKRLREFVENKHVDGICDKCNSFGQWLIDTYGEDAIENYWSKKNIISPFEIAKKSCKKSWLICQNCKTEKFIEPYLLFKFGHIMCNACSDGISYPNKFMFNLLKQLNVNFISELSHVDFDWIEENRKYDFYLPDYKLIIEMDGDFHYKNNTISKQDVNISKNIDKKKQDLALKHNIYTIRIDCNYGRMLEKRHEYVKNNIVHSHLNQIFDLSNIDWIKIENTCLESYVKRACDMWNNNIDMNDIAKELNVNHTTISRYLTRGNAIGLCNYTTKENHKNTREYAKERCKEICNKKVEVFKDGVSYGIFESLTTLCNKSKELFGVEFSISKVSCVMKGKRNHHRGYVFKKVEDTEVV